MTPERARELLGGLSAGILTPEEQHLLFEAALHDQALFNEVADELEFAAFLQSPETRAQLANRIEVDPPRRRWWALRPAWLALCGVLAASTVLFVVVWNRSAEIAPRDAATNSPAPRVTTPMPASKELERQQAAQSQEPAKSGNEIAEGKPAAAPRQQTTVTLSNARHKAMKQSVAPLDKAKAEEDIRRDQRPQNAPATEPAPQSFGNQSSGTGGRSAMARSTPPVPATPQPAAPAPVSTPPPPAVGGAVPGLSPDATASLRGAVHDPSGAPVAHATIDIINTVNNTTTRTSSDESGRFVAPPLAPGGPYTVTAAARGFKKEERSGITLMANQPAQIDIPLQVGQASETVAVTASANGVPTSAAPVNQGLTGQSAFPTSQIAVLDFANRTPQAQSGQQAADLLSTRLFDSGQRVIDREKVQQAWTALSQQSQPQSQAKSGRPPTAKEAAALGSMLGADAVIIGTVQTGAVNGSKDSRDRGVSNVALTAQVIDTKKARTMPKVAANAASLQGATNQLGLALQSQLAQPLTGDVMGVDSGLVSITFKAPAQPRIGARFDVYRGSRKIGELTLTSAYGQSATGKFSGAPQPRRGDRVISSR